MIYIFKKTKEMKINKEFAHIFHYPIGYNDVQGEDIVTGKRYSNDYLP